MAVRDLRRTSPSPYLGIRELLLRFRRSNTLALPFCCLTLRAEKPEDSRYPTELRTLGDHLRARRLDRGLRQQEVAARIGVTPWTLSNWELGHNSPETRHLPAIHDFLDYQPFEPGDSFSETLRFLRRSAGPSQEQLAARTDFDESTTAKWKRGDKVPLAANLERLRSFFQSAGRSMPGFETELSFGTSRLSWA